MNDPDFAEMFGEFFNEKVLEAAQKLNPTADIHRAAATDATIRPIRVWFTGNSAWQSGTLHLVAVVDGYQIWATCWHVTEGADFAPLVEQYGECYRMERRAHPDRPDVHLFCRDRGAIEAWKRGCPAPEVVSREFGLEADTYVDQPIRPSVGRVAGFPHGVVDGPPQVRQLKPYMADGNSVRGLLWFHTEEPVVGGMSGGLLSALDGAASKGVLVATAGRGRDFFALAQPFHNEMTLVRV